MIRISIMIFIRHLHPWIAGQTARKSISLPCSIYKGISGSLVFGKRIHMIVQLKCPSYPFSVRSLNNRVP
jgi:hypothetical protein